VPSPIEIRHSKVKLAALLVIALVFFAGGVWFWNLTDEEILAGRRLKIPIVVHGLGFCLMAMGSLCGALILRNHFNASPGLIISDEGLSDNTNPLSVGFIPWSAVRAIEIHKVHKDHEQKVLYVILLTPERVFANSPLWKRLLSRLAMRIGPSPIGISSTGLDIDFEQLALLIAQRFRLWQQRTSTQTQTLGSTPKPLPMDRR
jgi:hypothetical protein